MADKKLTPKTKEELSEEAEKVYRKILSNEVKTRVTDKINIGDPAVMKAIKLLLEDSEK